MKKITQEIMNVASAVLVMFLATQTVLPQSVSAASQTVQVRTTAIQDASTLVSLFGTGASMTTHPDSISASNFTFPNPHNYTRVGFGGANPGSYIGLYDINPTGTTNICGQATISDVRLHLRFTANDATGSGFAVTFGIWNSTVGSGITATSTGPDGTGFSGVVLAPYTPTGVEQNLELTPDSLPSSVSEFAQWQPFISLRQATSGSNSDDVRIDDMYFDVTYDDSVCPVESVSDTSPTGITTAQKLSETGQATIEPRPLIGLFGTSLILISIIVVISRRRAKTTLN